MAVGARAYDPSRPTYEDPLVVELKAERNPEKIFALLLEHQSTYLKASGGKANLLSIVLSYVRDPEPELRTVERVVDLIIDGSPELLDGLVGPTDERSAPLEGVIFSPALVSKILRALPNPTMRNFLRKMHSPIIRPDLLGLQNESARGNFAMRELIREKIKALKPFYTFEELKKLLTVRPPRTLKEFVERLPEEFRQNYVLSYGSRGLEASKGHPTSDERPRVIFFSPDASLMVAWQEGVEATEIIRFNDANPAAPYEFFRHAFTGDLDFRRDRVGVRATICNECHLKDASPGSFPRPNVNPYHVWQTYFGSNDDDAAAEPNRSGMNAYTRDFADEQRGLSKFHAFVRTHPESVYNSLPNLESRFPLKDSEGGRGYGQRPNFQFTAANAVRNVERIAGELTQHKKIARYRHLLAWMARGYYCRDRKMDRRLVAFEAEGAALHADLASLMLTQGRIFDSDPHHPKPRDGYTDFRALPAPEGRTSVMDKIKDELRLFSGLRILEKLTGDNLINGGKKIANWSQISFKDDIATFSLFSSGGNSLVDALLPSLYRVDPVLNNEARATGKFPSCDELEKAAVKDLEGLGYGAQGPRPAEPPKFAAEPAEHGSQVFNRHCVDCHAPGKKLPIDPGALTGKTRSANSSPDRSLRDEILERLRPGTPHPMPKRDALTDEELRVLRAFIQKEEFSK